MQYRGYLIALFAGVAFAALVMFWGPADRIAQAQTTATPTRTPSTEEEIFRMRKFLEKTKPSDFGSPPTSAANAEKHQRIMTRASRKVLNPKFGQQLVKGAGPAGLAVAAAGVWVGNGVTLYNQATCGNTTCESINVDTQFRQATYDLDANGSGSGFGKR